MRSYIPDRLDRLRPGHAFSDEVRAVRRGPGDNLSAGFSTDGQIAEVEGQLSGFHVCTAVVCVLDR